MSDLKTTLIRNKPYSFLEEPKATDINLASKIKTSIEEDITSEGLLFRLAELTDVEKISAFQKEIFHPHTETLENEYELFRIIKFGYALLIENVDKNILGCYTTINYSGLKGVAYGIRVGISREIAGHNFAVKLAKYATVLAFEAGSKSFEALMSPTNFRSASNVLNHIGYYCKEFHRNLPSFGTRFEISLPLDLKNLDHTKVSIGKVVHFIKTQAINKDYLLFEPSEIDRIEKIYSSTDFKIIAFLRKGTIDDKDYFFAIRPLNSQQS
jgi:hypothetical protein